MYVTNYIMLFFPAPTGPPTSVRSEIISATSIKILWDSPLPSDSNGVITMYTVCFGDQGQTCTETVVNASPTLEYIYTSLVPETTYVFQVRAHTGVGPGPYSVLQNQTTREYTTMLLTFFHKISKY